VATPAEGAGDVPEEVSADFVPVVGGGVGLGQGRRRRVHDYRNSLDYPNSQAWCVDFFERSPADRPKPFSATPPGIDPVSFSEPIRLRRLLVW